MFLDSFLDFARRDCLVFVVIFFIFLDSGGIHRSQNILSLKTCDLELMSLLTWLRVRGPPISFQELPILFLQVNLKY